MIDRVVPHMPYSSMGSDVGDLLNDGHIDLLVADMAATTHEEDQRSMADSRSRAPRMTRPGARPPVREKRPLPEHRHRPLLEAAFLAGIEATDWTWSPRFEDLDNDGRLNLFVTNGMYREAHNVDLLARQAAADTPNERLRISVFKPGLRRNPPRLPQPGRPSV